MAFCADDLAHRKRLAEMRSSDGFEKGASVIAEGIAGEEDEPRHQVRVPALDLPVEGGAISARHSEIAQDHVIGPDG